jgi:16S rRNA (guanine966-N2)-methyltransferase
VLNMLQGEIGEALILDLFAGSGAVGIEAMSRGARGCVFVEKAPQAARCLGTNLEALRRRAASQKLEAGLLEVVVRDAGEALTKLGRYGTFDLVFVDPPYREAVRFVDDHSAALAQLVSPGGTLVMETDVKDEERLAVVDAAGFAVVKRRAYGDTMISIWEKLTIINDKSEGDGE